MNYKDIYILAAQRSPIGSFQGGLSPLSLIELGTQTLIKTLANKKIDPKIIDTLILGNVLAAGEGQGPARQMAIHAGLDYHTPAYGLNMICGSGLKAVINAYSDLQLGLSQVAVAMGAESMSNAAFVLPGKTRRGHKMNNLELVDTMVYDALTDAFEDIHMGITAENIVDKLTLTRKQQDEFALLSHQRATNAINNGAFKAEIVPILVKNRKNEFLVEVDEGPRPNLTIEQLEKLRPVFKKDGSVTAGNASSLNDGAAVVVLATAEALKLHNLTPVVKIVAVGQDGIDPAIMGLGPIGAIEKALTAANLTLDQIDLLELNEAFASQSIGVLNLLSEKHQVSVEALLKKTNLNGGAIALGHPVGCSGTRILVTLIHLLQAQNKRYGLATLCIGGGMGVAIIVENCGWSNH